MSARTTTTRSSFGSISVPANNDPMDLNAPDIGAAYLPQYQDPTAPASTVPGARALPTDLMRPYRGLGAIIATRPIFYTQYDSLQTSFNRRFRNGWQGGVNWTLSLRHQGQHAFRRSTCSTTPTARSGCGPSRRPSTKCCRTRACGGISSRATSSGIFPTCPRTSGPSKVLAAIANDWQLSGVFTGGSGAPYDATYSYQTAGANVNLTGSPNYRARIRTVGDIGSGCSSDQYAQFNATAFAGPTYNSLGDESGANLLNGCWDKTTDLAIARNIRVGGSRQVQFRLDLFNAFNAIVINARNTTIQYNSPSAATTITNNQFNADGTRQPRATDAGDRRRGRGHRRAGDAHGADAASVHVLGAFQ